MSASDTPRDQHITYSITSTSSPSFGSNSTQLSGPTGVPTEVSSVAIDRGLLNVAVSLPIAADAMSNIPEITTDAEIMLRVKTGDESAFTFLVQKYRRQMVGFMYRMCHNPAAAEELAQEVFLRVYRSRENYEASAKFTT